MRNLVGASLVLSAQWAVPSERAVHRVFIEGENVGGLGEVESVDRKLVGKFPLTSIGGPSRGSRVRRPGSEDPHRLERKF